MSFWWVMKLMADSRKTFLSPRRKLSLDSNPTMKTNHTAKLKYRRKRFEWKTGHEQQWRAASSRNMKCDSAKSKMWVLPSVHGNTRPYKLEFKLGFKPLNPKWIMIHAWKQVKWNRTLSLKKILIPSQIILLCTLYLYKFNLLVTTLWY